MRTSVGGTYLPFVWSAGISFSSLPIPALSATRPLKGKSVLLKKLVVKLSTRSVFTETKDNVRLGARDVTQDISHGHKLKQTGLSSKQSTTGIIIRCLWRAIRMPSEGVGHTLPDKTAVSHVPMKGIKSEFYR